MKHFPCGNSSSMDHLSSVVLFCLYVAIISELICL